VLINDPVTGAQIKITGQFVPIWGMVTAPADGIINLSTLEWGPKFLRKTGAPFRMINQDDFNNFVDSYNSDFVDLLKRASTGNYECLISSFRVLKDLLDIVSILKSKSNFEYQIQPYPLIFRGNSSLLGQLGFNQAEIQMVDGFLSYVKDSQGREFEECLTDKKPIMCSRQKPTE
jgi:hypothetical protein